MKFLSFSYNDNELYGVKVKREESAWNLIKVLEDFDNTDMFLSLRKQQQL